MKIFLLLLYYRIYSETSWKRLLIRDCPRLKVKEISIQDFITDQFSEQYPNKKWNNDITSTIYYRNSYINGYVLAIVMLKQKHGLEGLKIEIKRTYIAKYPSYNDWELSFTTYQKGKIRPIRIHFQL
jgi:hypothetical protein